MIQRFMHIYLFAAMIVVLFPLQGKAQKISDLHFEQSGKKILVSYDLGGDMAYNIKVYCSTNKGKSWGASLKAVSGDVGGFIRPGENKLIVWDVLSEIDELKGDVSFKIEAQVAVKTYKSSFLPVCVPGARINHYPKGKGLGIFKAIVFYGLMGTSAAFIYMSRDNYDKYHQATRQEDMDKYYSKASSYRSYYQATLIIGLAGYGYDLIYYSLRGFPPRNSRFSAYYDEHTKTTNLTFVYKF